MAWSTSDRRQRLPPDWDDIRAEVKQRAQGRCQAREHDPRCTGTGTDADHITPGDDHTLPNLQWLSGPCHRAKTARESAARNTARAAARVRTETHPGELP